MSLLYTCFMSYLSISPKRLQFYNLLLQVLFVGMTVGLFRTVIPVFANQEFSDTENSFVLIATFVIIFGLIKAFLNFVAGSLSDKTGRRKILIFGWLVALPIPLLLGYADSWTQIILATILLGINQGFCWSMSQTMKIDSVGSSSHGLAIGLNETFGYVGVALAGYASALLTDWWGMQTAMVSLGSSVIGAGLIMSFLFCRETIPGEKDLQRKVFTWQLIWQVSWHNKATMALNFSGLVEKFADTLVWLIYPVYLYQRGTSLTMIGLITGVYAGVWGVSQFPIGIWSDRIGRKPMIVGGMVICAIGSTMTLWSPEPLWWIVNAALIGLGMAMLYPTLAAAINDLAPVSQRGTILGIYRFWRDLGYFVGAILLSFVIVLSGFQEAAFIITTISLLIGALLVVMLTPETYRK